MGLPSAHYGQTIYADGPFATKKAKHKQTSTTDWKLGVPQKVLSQKLGA